MRIVVIDGQGGGMGKSIIENIRKKYHDSEIIAVGTNSPDFGRKTTKIE